MQRTVNAEHDAQIHILIRANLCHPMLSFTSQNTNLKEHSIIHIARKIHLRATKLRLAKILHSRMLRLVANFKRIGLVRAISEKIQYNVLNTMREFGATTMAYR